LSVPLATSAGRAQLVLLLAYTLINQAAGLQLATASARTQSRCASPILKGKASAKGFGAAPPAKAKKATSATRRQPQTIPEADDRVAAESRGRDMLAAMRKEAGENPNPVRPPALRNQLTPEELAPVDAADGVMPEVVSNRMLKRVIPFAGLPVIGAFLLFFGFWYANTQMGMDLPPSAVAYSTQALFFLSFAGISWGVMSTSWDEESEGSLLGADEVRKNTAAMRAGLDRSRGEAAAMYDEMDAADAGIIMSEKALQRVEKRRAKEEANQEK